VSAPRSAWRGLGIEPTREVAAIRSAYAAALKRIDPDADPAAFEALRKAREQALVYARSNADAPAEEAPAASPHLVVPSGELAYSLTTPTLPEGTAPGNLGAIAPPETDGNFRTIEPPVPGGGEEHLIPLRTAHGALTPPVLGGSPASSTLESRPLIAPPARDAHYRALLGLLFGEEGRFEPLTDETIRRELITHAEALLHDPQMVEIGFYAEAERWFARIVATSAPRSDPIMHLVLDQFGWLADRGRFDQPKEAAAVVARYDMLAFHAAVQQPDHPLFRAWRELITPADETSRRGRVDKKAIHELLLTVRRDHPALEQEFDWYRVSLWESPPPASSRGNGNPWVTVAVFMVILLGQLGRCGSALSPSTIDPSIVSGPTMNGPILMPPAPLADALVSPDDDIAAALQRVAGDELTLDRLKEKNPSLAMRLESNWQDAKKYNQTRRAFVEEMSRLLLVHYNDALPHAEYAVIADQRRLDLDETTAALNAGGDVCARYFDKGLPMPLALRFAQRRDAITARVLLGLKFFAPLRSGSYTFTVPGAVVDDATRRAGLPRAQFAAGLRATAAPKLRCKVRIALLQAALALPPKAGLKLLREM